MINLRKTPFILVGFLVLVGLIAPVVQAEESKTPAGTEITNQGVIIYEDDSGQEYSTTSNEVTLVVTEVYGISILPDGTTGSPGQGQVATADQRVYFPYKLTNTGNTKDKYVLTPTFAGGDSDFRPKLPDGSTGMEVFWDQNTNGKVEDGEPKVASWRDVDDNGNVDSDEVSRSELGPMVQDESTNLIIAYDLPAGASSGDVAYAGVDGASTHNGSVPGGASEVDIGNIHEVETVDDAAVTVTKSVDPSEVSPGDAITYTLTGENKGSASAAGRSYDVDGSTDNYTGVLIYDDLPIYEGSAFEKTGTPSGSHAGSSEGTVIYANPSDSDTDPTGWNWSTSYSAGDKVIGYLTSDGSTHQDLQIDETITLEFSVEVPSDHPAGNVDNYGFVNYEDSSGEEQEVRSNDALVEVETVAGVDIADTDYIFSDNNPPDDGSGSSNDTETYSTAAAGSTLEFTNRVTNEGSDDDVMDITLASDSNIPSDWSVTFYGSDGLTPLRDTDGDGVPDTGSIPPGGYRDIVVKVSVPGDQGSTTDTKTAYIKATSSNNTTETDTTEDRIQEVTEAGVDIRNRDGGGDPSPTISAGECANYPLDVENTGGAPDLFTLSSSLPGPGWTATFYRDADDDGVLDDSEKDPVTQTVELGSGEQDHFIAVVCSPEDASPGTDKAVDFTATSTNNDSVTDTVEDTINVSEVCKIDIRPDRSSTVRPGGIKWYDHTLENTGDSETTVTLELASTQPDWNHQLYYAESYSNGSGHSYSEGDLIVDTDGDDKPDIPNLASGESVDFQLKLFAPSDASDGIVDVTQITATAVCGFSDEVADITTVVTGGLVLQKSQSVDDTNGNGTTGDPGDRITYTTSYKNISAGPLSAVTVYEQIPDKTSYVVGSADGGSPPASLSVTIEFSDDGGDTWNYTPSGTVDPAVTNIRWKLGGPLPAGAESQAGVSFKVEIE